MSLLDKATLITTPTAHSNGTLHSIKGGAVADFDVVRGSAATRVNAEGLIEDISILSGELVTNGDFSNGSTDWVLASEWSVVNNQATTLGVSLTSIRQTVLVNGTNRLTFDVVEGGAIVYTNYPIFSIKATFSTVGTHTIDLLSDGVGTNQLLYIYNNGAGNGATIDNVSVVEVTDATNIPRIDYTTGEGVVLLEPQSTNLVVNSEPTANDGTASDILYENFNWAIGFTNCVKYGDNSTLRWRYGGTVSASTEYTLSAFVIMDDLSEPIIGGQTSDKDFTFVLGGGVFSTANPSVNMGNNIWRVSVTAITSASPNAGNNGIIKYTEQSNKGFRVVGYQLEALPYATSYIPTSGAIATRLADSVTGAGDASTLNSTEGVLYFEGSALANDGTSRQVSLSSGSSATDKVSINYSTTSNQLQAFVRAGGSISFNVSEVLSNIANNNKIALKYKANDFALWVNGIEVATNTSGNAPTGLNVLDFDDADGGSDFYGKVKALAVFNEALTDSELECLTKI